MAESGSGECSVRPVAIITGAGSGIGRATAVLLAAEGFNLVLVSRRAEALQATADLAREDSPEAEAEVCAADVGSADDARRFVDVAVTRFGRIDALINNAGSAPVLPIDKSTPEAIDQAYRVNALGPAYATHFAWTQFARQAARKAEIPGYRGGCVVFTSTLGTSDPFPGFFAYAGAKSCVNLMAKSCAKEGRSLGVRAFSVAPGAVETQMLRANFNEKMVPPSKCLAPEDVAKVITDCVMGRRDGENGATIFLNKT